MSNLVTYKKVMELPKDSLRVSRWTQRLYKTLQTHNDSRDADILFKSFTAMATPMERRQLKVAYEVIKAAFMVAYDAAKAADTTPTPDATPVVRYDSKWGGDYVAYRHYAKDTAWLDTQHSVMKGVR